MCYVLDIQKSSLKCIIWPLTLKELVLALIWWFFFHEKKIVPRREDSVRTSKIHLIIMKVLHQAPPKCFHHFRFHHHPSKWCDAEVKAFNFKWPKWFVATFDLCPKLLWPVLSWIPLQKVFYIHTHTKIFRKLFPGTVCVSISEADNWLISDLAAKYQRDDQFF